MESSNNEYQTEYAFVCSLLAKPELIKRCADKIKPEYLQNAILRRIYCVMVEDENLKLPDIAEKSNVSMAELLKMSGELPLTSQQTFDGYAYGVLEYFKKRKIEDIRHNTPAEQIGDEIATVQALQYFDVDDGESAVNEYLHNVERKYTGKNDERIVPTFFYGIDNAIDGLRKSELIIIGGRPGSGKTAFAINMAYKMACNFKKVLFFSLEMCKADLLDRMVRCATGISNYAKMSPEQFNEVIMQTREIAKLNLIINDKPGITFEEIYYTAKREENLDCIFVDHLSILKSRKKYKSRYEEISDLSRRLKCLARDLDVPVVCLCQLNRNLESREMKAPTMADLRDSGSIEQDADLIGFIYRQEYHLMNNEPDNKDSPKHLQWETMMQQVKGKAQLILAKNRRGICKRFDFNFKPTIYKFTEEGVYHEHSVESSPTIFD